MTDRHRQTDRRSHTIFKGSFFTILVRNPKNIGEIHSIQRVTEMRGNVYRGYLETYSDQNFIGQ